jgi:hypothetical protein
MLGMAHVVEEPDPLVVSLSSATLTFDGGGGHYVRSAFGLGSSNLELGKAKWLIQARVLEPKEYRS